MSDLPQGVVDDASVAGETRLLRRVPIYQVHEGKVQSNAFDERAAGCGLSVTAWENPGDLDDVLAGHEGFAVICVTADDVRSVGGIIVRSPLPNNPTHCEIFPRLSSGLRKKLRAMHRWVRYPDWVSEEHRGPLEAF